jgi:diacylglycerol O-acyltransferase
MAVNASSEGAARTDGQPRMRTLAKDPPPRPLSDEDLAILELECETVAGHTCKVIVLEGPIDPTGLRASIASRLDRAPELALRLGEIDGVRCWVDGGQAPDLDRHVVLDGGGVLDDAGLRSAVARIFEQRLDRSEPLWQLDVIPELAGGGSALVWRIHHALADGTTAMRIASAVLWDEADGDADSGGSPHAPNSDSGRGAGGGAGGGGGAVAGAVTAQPHRLGLGLSALAREAPRPWRRSPFDGRIDAQRTVAFATADLVGLHRVARATHGATVNDAVLTVVAGGLRRWLEAHHGHLGAVRVKVPVSLHGADHAHPDETPEAGNRDSYFCLDLPLGPPDPAERLAAVRRATKARKQDHDAERLDSMMRELGHCSPGLRRFADHVLAQPRSFALNVSNVPGPRRPVNVLGVPALALYSIAEIGERHALRIAVLSLAGTLRLGLCADPTLLPGVEHLAADIESEAAALLAHEVQP